MVAMALWAVAGMLICDFYGVLSYCGVLSGCYIIY